MVKWFKQEVSWELPDDVEVKVDGKKFTIKGKLGTVVKDFSHMTDLEIALEGKKVVARAFFPRKRTVAKMGTFISIIKNAVIGVTKGYTYKMKVAYSHFPISVEVQGDKILIKNFLGERAPRITYKADKNVDVIVQSKEDVIVKGIDKEKVGQTVANIQRRCRIKDKDHRKFQDGIYVYEKLAGDEVIWKIKI